MPLNAGKIQRQLTLLADRWPKDKIRPQQQFRDGIVALSHQHWTTQRQMELANASAKSLERILNNEANRRFPPSAKLLQPKSYPKHYVVLKEAIERIENGDEKMGLWDFIKSRVKW